MINIGETIAAMRKEKAMTQEQLSEIFGVSIAAVSKWETGTAYPDIELLPKIAVFFDISIDRLLGYDMSKTETNIDECLEKVNVLVNERKCKEALAILSDLVYKYPNNVKVLVRYAKVKYQSAHGSPRNENHKKLFKEAEEILLSINRNGISNSDRALIDGTLYSLYLWNKKFDKAEKILADLKPAYEFENFNSAEFWFYVHKGDMETARAKYYSLLERLLLDNALIHGRYHAFYDTPEKIIDSNNKLIKVLQIFEEDLSVGYGLSVLRESNAFMYARLGKKEETLEAIDIMIEAAAKNGETREQFTEWFMKLANCGEREEYSLIKDSDEFRKLTEKLNK